MKIERLNSAIFYVSGVVFLFQSIGYLAPAWFINEIKENHEVRGFAVDGKRLVLPYWQKQIMTGTVNGIESSRENTPMPEPSSIKSKSTTRPSKRGIGSHNTPMPSNNSMNRPWKPDSAPNNVMRPGANTRKPQHVTMRPEHSRVQHGNEHPSPSLFGTPKSKSNEQRDQQMANGDTESKSGGVKTSRKHMLYLNAGLWYARVCVNSHRMDGMMSVEGPGIEWCTMYIRTNGSALGNMKNMFELRLEASFGLGFSLISLLAACTCCCSQRHHGKRMIVSLGSMFISGAVMAVPVAYTIIEHVKTNQMVMRHRMWKYFLINTHTKHDLFDHWSAILCGVACIISICSTLLFAILACRSNRKPSNWYKFQKGGSMISNDKHSLPTHWITGSKLKMSTDMTIVDEHQLKDDDVVDNMFTQVQEVQEVQEDTRSSSVHDGGDSIKGGAVAETNEAFDFNETEDQISESSEPVS